MTMHSSLQRAFTTRRVLKVISGLHNFEAESELVSGFNTEYSGAFFAFIFLSEYGVLLISCGLIYFLFLSSKYIIHINILLNTIY